MKIKGYELRTPFFKEPLKQRLLGYNAENDDPEMKVQMPYWMMNPPHGSVRRMRNGEIFNAAEMRLLGSSAIVWQCKQRIANAVASCEWNLLPVDPKTVATAKITEIAQLLRNPNTNKESFMQLLTATVMDILDLDAGAIVKVFGKYLKNKVVQLYSRDGSTFTKEPDKYGRILGYWQYFYSGIVDPIRLEPRELIYISANPRSDSNYGESPVESIRLICRNMIKGIEAQELIFRKGGIPSGIMGFEGMNNQDFDSFKAYWANTQKNKLYKQAMINTKTTWVPFITSFRDLEFLDSQKWFTELVYRTFNVPHGGIGTGAKDTKGSVMEEDTKFMRETVRPKLLLIEEAINQQLIPEFFGTNEKPTVYFHFDIIDKLAELGELETWQKKFEWGTATVNEYRKSKALPELSWGNMNPSMSKAIQQVCQSWFYGAFGTKELSDILGIKIDESAVRKLLTKVPPKDETQPE